MTTSVPTVCQAVISPQTRHRGRDRRDLGSTTTQGSQAPLDPITALGSARLQVRTRTQVAGQDSEETPSPSQPQFRRGAQGRCRAPSPTHALARDDGPCRQLGEAGGSARTCRCFSPAEGRRERGGGMWRGMQGGGGRGLRGKGRMGKVLENGGLKLRPTQMGVLHRCHIETNSQEHIRSG